MEDMRIAYKILVTKPEGHDRLRNPRCKWKDDMEMDLKKLDWIEFSWLRMRTRCELM
jgi:hypothetical protein